MDQLNSTSFIVNPIAWISNERTTIQDDNWADVISTITLDEKHFSVDALKGIELFSHLVIVYLMHKVNPEKIVYGARHPRNLKDISETGIFAQRAKSRPNRLGVSCCQLVSCSNLTLTVKSFDAIDGTPVLDIKPYMQSFDPRSAVDEPEWVETIMKHYY